MFVEDDCADPGRRDVRRRVDRRHVPRRRRRHGRRQGPARGRVPRADAQPRAAQALRQVAARRPAAVRAAGVRQDVPRAGGGRRAGRPVRRGDAGRRARHVHREQREEPARAVRDGTGATRRACCSSTRSTPSARSAASCATPRCARWSTSCWSSSTTCTTANEGVFVLGATNHPWDVDSALRRPGRFDRTLLVLPPDQPAREAIVKLHLRDRPVAGVDARKIAKVDRRATPAPTWHTSARVLPSGRCSTRPAPATSG